MHDLQAGHHESHEIVWCSEDLDLYRLQCRQDCDALLESQIHAAVREHEDSEENPSARRMDVEDTQYHLIAMLVILIGAGEYQPHICVVVQHQHEDANYPHIHAEGEDNQERRKTVMQDILIEVTLRAYEHMPEETAQMFAQLHVVEQCHSIGCFLQVAILGEG